VKRWLLGHLPERDDHVIRIERLSMPLRAVDLELELEAVRFQLFNVAPGRSLRGSVFCCVSRHPYADSASAPQASFCRPRSLIEREALGGVLLQRGCRMGRGLPFLPCSWSGQSQITSSPHADA
jgi:hypothetical protein